MYFEKVHQVEGLLKVVEEESQEKALKDISQKRDDIIEFFLEAPDMFHLYYCY